MRFSPTYPGLRGALAAAVALAATVSCMPQPAATPATNPDMTGGLPAASGTTGSVTTTGSQPGATSTSAPGASSGNTGTSQELQSANPVGAVAQAVTPDGPMVNADVSVYRLGDNKPIATGKAGSNGAFMVDLTGAVFDGTPLEIVAKSGDKTVASIGQAGSIADGGGALISAGGGNVISHNGSQLVAAGAGNVISHNGGQIVAAGAGNIVAAGAGNYMLKGLPSFTLGLPTVTNDAVAKFKVAQASRLFVVDVNSTFAYLSLRPRFQAAGLASIGTGGVVVTAAVNQIFTGFNQLVQVANTVLPLKQSRDAIPSLLTAFGDDGAVALLGNRFSSLSEVTLAFDRVATILVEAVRQGIAGGGTVPTGTTLGRITFGSLVAPAVVISGSRGSTTVVVTSGGGGGGGGGSSSSVPSNRTTFSGRVLLGVDGPAVQGAIISAAGSGATEFATTGADGRFSFTVDSPSRSSGDNTVIVGASNLTQSKTVSVSGTGTVDAGTIVVSGADVPAGTLGLGTTGVGTLSSDLSISVLLIDSVFTSRYPLPAIVRPISFASYGAGPGIAESDGTLVTPRLVILPLAADAIQPSYGGQPQYATLGTNVPGTDALGLKHGDIVPLMSYVTYKGGWVAAAPATVVRANSAESNTSLLAYKISQHAGALGVRGVPNGHLVLVGQVSQLGFCGVVRPTAATPGSGVVVKF